MYRLADLMEANIDELAALESLNVGKVFANSKGFDMLGAISVFRYYAGFADKIHGETVEVCSHPLNLHATSKGFNNRPEMRNFVMYGASLGEFVDKSSLGTSRWPCCPGRLLLHSPLETVLSLRYASSQFPASLKAHHPPAVRSYTSHRAALCQLCG
jgi:Aldehyde dehydrogenase family